MDCLTCLCVCVLEIRDVFLDPGDWREEETEGL